MGIKGDNGSSLKEIDPFRYRSYYYDTETGLYFLKTRFYDPEVGRFITIDDISLAPDTINGLNLYAYCGNNPVMRVDPNGNAWWHWVLGIIVVAVLVGLTIATAGGFGAGLMAIGFAANGMVMAGASMATTILAFASVGAAVALTASAVVAGINAVETWATGGSFSAGLNEIKDYGTTALDATIGGGIFGGLMGFGAYKLAHPRTSDDIQIEKALKELDRSGVRPGQTEVSKNKILQIYNNYDSTKAQSSIYSDGRTRYIVDGHHTTIASQMRGQGTGFNMGMSTNMSPSATDIYWTKKWYEIWKKAIKIKP